MPELASDEKILDEKPYEENLTLVHDGNSRWERDGDTLYFIVNANYKAPETDA